MRVRVRAQRRAGILFHSSLWDVWIVSAYSAINRDAAFN